MQPDLSSIEYLCGNKDIVSYEKSVIKPFEPFADIVCSFLNEVSLQIMKQSECRAYPDIITFGFFCRKANTEKLKNDYAGRLKNRIGRGVSFHIAPSNVPVNFAYSMTAALLAGNACIVRVSEKKFRQTEIICNIINQVIRTSYGELSEYISVIRYPHSDQINLYISGFTDMRIVWGGDNTIYNIRKAPLPPRGIEIAFADRYSIAVINSEQYLKITDKKRIASDFYNDTYLYDQNACSSPQMIYWIGEDQTTIEAKEIFWGHMYDVVLAKYKMEPVVAVDKYITACSVTIDSDVHIIRTADNKINRIQVNRLFKNIYDYRCAGGSFIEYDSLDLNDLSEIITNKYQTVAYIGIDKNELSEFIIKNRLMGVDRVVPVGKTSDFSLTWDGYDLIETMSRTINVV